MIEANGIEANGIGRYYESWGRYPKVKPAKVEQIFWQSEIPDISKFDTSILPYGLGKSYGDSCLNENGTLLDTSGMNHLISFDEESGLIRCEAGFTLKDALDFLTPRGFFLATTPGTKHITVAGAVANDVHGKNHHVCGSFGHQVTQFELLRSNGQKLICSPIENKELFAATIGGLGLTGLITWVEFKNQKVTSPFIAMESIKFGDVDEFFAINDESNDFSYTVSWIDCTASGGSLGRGLYSRGNHADPTVHDIPGLPKEKEFPFPFEAPFINPFTVSLFNFLFYNKQFRPIEKSIVHYDPFFYPLDAVNNWNKAYGKNGFLQYQFVVPFASGKDAIKEILKYVSQTGLSSFLTVLKTFGNMRSLGMLSFPRPGITLAIDFRMNGDETLNMLCELDNVVRDAGGVIYPAKDARMTAEDFQLFYPEWKEFEQYIDPKFSSSFWRRVMKNS